MLMRALNMELRAGQQETLTEPKDVCNEEENRFGTRCRGYQPESVVKDKGISALWRKERTGT